MRIKLPDSAYGFLTGSGETQNRTIEYYGATSYHVFIIVSSTLDWKVFAEELKTLNYDLNFRFLTSGYNGDQFERMMCTLKFEVSKKPLEQLKLFQ